MPARNLGLSDGQKPLSAAYTSIFLADDWAHQTYLGWSVFAEEPGIRILAKQRLLAKRFLVLFTSPGSDRLCFWIRRLSDITGLSEIIIHDFDNLLVRYQDGFHNSFRLAKKHERLLNINTFVFDLKRTDNELISQMSSDYRRKIRKAASGDVTVEAHLQPDSELQKLFVHALNDFAIGRNINFIGKSALAAMYRGGNGILLVARKNGRITNFLHLYKANNSAIFMYGVSLCKENDGVGQLIHFEAIRRLREQGIRWYDLGGVSSTDTADGIFVFKQKFGAANVDLGCEWRNIGVVLAVGMTLIRTFKRLTNMIKSCTTAQQ
jgi:hypothetical protein